jgi:hypothetical protein
MGLALPWLLTPKKLLVKPLINCTVSQVLAHIDLPCMGMGKHINLLEGTELAKLD